MLGAKGERPIRRWWPHSRFGDLMLRKLLLVSVVVAVLAVATACSGSGDDGTAPGAGSRAGAPVPTGPAANSAALPCPLFPADNVWNTDVSDLPVHPDSETYVRSIGLGENLHPDFGSGTWEGAPIGIPYNVVAAGTAGVDVSFDYDDESDPGPYPIPSNPAIEGGANGDGDRHVLIVEEGACTLYELYAAERNRDGTWDAGSGAIWDLGSNALRPASWTSADGAGLPILPGLVRYDEVAAGTIDHAIRFTAPETHDSFVWPARHEAGQSDDELPPMGLRVRLKADFDVSTYPTEVQVILRAMQRYGMILADNGSPWFITGAPDERWDNEGLVRMKDITGESFEAVDTSSLVVDPDSGEVRR